MKNNQNHIHLFGNPEENFYILGRKDKSSFNDMYKQISMLCARNQHLSKILKLVTELSAQMSKDHKHSDFYRYIMAYADGLERAASDVNFALLLPEIVASFNKWLPNLMGLIPGCSSVFMQDPKTKDVLHGRILDYALSGPFEKYERSILYEFTKAPKIFSYSSTGMPFPSLSSMNEDGLSLALHYKHGQYFNMDGDSIFQITDKIINQCQNIKQAVKLIKKQESISYWGIYLIDPSGEAVSVDIKGNEIYQERFNICDHKYLYFNNRPILKQKDQSNIQPYGNESQCKMRRKEMQVILKKPSSIKNSDPLLALVKNLGKPLSKKKKNAKDWNLSPTNLSSIQLYGFNLTKQSAIHISGPAPKFYLGEYCEYTDIFRNIRFKQKKNKIEEDHYIKGQRLLSKYQSSLDLGEIALAYHEIQMAISYLKGYPEYYIAKFYFTIIQYLYESDKRDFTYIYDDFENLQEKLPSYLEDHRQLFKMRTAKIIGHKVLNEADKIVHPELRNFYDHEFKLTPLALKALKHLIFPRIEILDIIYSY